MRAPSSAAYSDDSADTEDAFAAHWSTCAVEDCIGVPLSGQNCCLAHVDDAIRDGFVANLRSEAKLDLRGTTISFDLLSRLLAAVKVGETLTLGDVWFRLAQFTGDVDFHGAQFNGEADFYGAQFSGQAWFSGAQFSGNATFSNAQFRGFTSFSKAQFNDLVWFEKSRFSAGAYFEGVQFSGDARFSEAWFSSIAAFHRSHFENVWFQRTRFSGIAGFQWAQFSGNAQFGRAQFSGSWFVSFRGAQFIKAGPVGPLVAQIPLRLDQAVFEGPVLLQAITPRLSCLGTTFKEAATIRLLFAQIIMDGATFARPSTISYAEDLSGGVNPSDLPNGGLSTKPRLLSLRQVDVSNLVLADLDLSACLFQGAHNLDKLRLEGPPPFIYSPPAWRLRLLGKRVPVWRAWTRRQSLAEEHQWRGSPALPPSAPPRLERPGWHPPASRVPDWLPLEAGQRVQRLAPDRLAALYRALRKALEDSKNAPGAADFYYGEMEMRRLSSTSPWSDRLALWFYWLFSGYGLRASRALTALALAVAFFALGFWRWGLDSPHGHPIGYTTALIRSFESATRLLNTSPPGLNEFGQLLDAVLRLIGAILLGLALFSLRGRIRR